MYGFIDGPLRYKRIYLVVELFLLVRILNEFKISLVFQFWLRWRVLCHKPSRRHYRPVKDGFRRLFVPVAAITGHSFLQHFLHSLSPFVSDPRAILSRHGKNTPRDTMERVGEDNPLKPQSGVSAGMKCWEAKSVVPGKGAPQFACRHKRIACYENPPQKTVPDTEGV